MKVKGTVIMAAMTLWISGALVSRTLAATAAAAVG